jgi:hypothetical protein
MILLMWAVQLQIMVTDETCRKLLQIYEYDRNRICSLADIEVSSRANAEALLSDEDVFRVVYVRGCLQTDVNTC